MDVTRSENRREPAGINKMDLDTLAYTVSHLPVIRTDFLISRDTRSPTGCGATLRQQRSHVMLSSGRRAAAERTRRWQYRDAQLKPEPCACEYPNSTIRSPSFSMVRSRDRGRTATGRPYETHRQFDLRTRGRRWPGAMHLSCQSTIHTTRSPHHQTSLSEHWLAGQRKQDTAQHTSQAPSSTSLALLVTYFT